MAVDAVADLMSGIGVGREKAAVLLSAADGDIEHATEMRCTRQPLNAGKENSIPSTGGQCEVVLSRPSFAWWLPWGLHLEHRDRPAPLAADELHPV
eukprot:gene16786-12084_t